MHQSTQGMKLAQMLKLQTLQYRPQTGKQLFRLIQLAEVTVIQRQRAYPLLQTLTQTAEDLHAGMNGLRPQRPPLMAYQRLEYRQTFIETEQASQLRTASN